MFFKSIAPLLALNIKLHLIVQQGEGDLIEVNVLPEHPTDANGKPMGKPLTSAYYTATAEELDQEFASIMGRYSSANVTLKKQLATFEAAAAQAVAEAKATPATTKALPAPAKRSAAGVAGKVKPTPTLMDDGADGGTGGDDDETDGSGSGCDTTSETPTPAPASAAAQSDSQSFDFAL